MLTVILRVRPSVELGDAGKGSEAQCKNILTSELVKQFAVFYFISQNMNKIVLPKFEAFLKIFVAMMIAKKMIDPTTNIMTIIKTTPSTPGTMSNSLSINADMSGGKHAFSQYEQEQPGLFYEAWTNNLFNID